MKTLRYGIFSVCIMAIFLRSATSVAHTNPLKFPSLDVNIIQEDTSLQFGPTIQAGTIREFDHYPGFWSFSVYVEKSSSGKSGEQQCPASALFDFRRYELRLEKVLRETLGSTVTTQIASRPLRILWGKFSPNAAKAARSFYYPDMPPPGRDLLNAKAKGLLFGLRTTPDPTIWIDCSLMGKDEVLSVLAHEVTHSFLYPLGLPRWLEEAVAQLVERAAGSEYPATNGGTALIGSNSLPPIVSPTDQLDAKWYGLTYFIGEYLLSDLGGWPQLRHLLRIDLSQNGGNYVRTSGEILSYFSLDWFLDFGRALICGMIPQWQGFSKFPAIPAAGLIIRPGQFIRLPIEFQAIHLNPNLIHMSMVPSTSEVGSCRSLRHQIALRSSIPTHLVFNATVVDQSLLMSDR